MKKQLKTSFLISPNVFAALLAAGMVACGQNAHVTTKGPKVDGQDAAQKGRLIGEKGDKGEPGNKISIGKGEPLGAQIASAEGDLYIDSDTFNLYQRKNAKWVLIGSMKGANGAGGVLASGGSFLSGTAKPEDALGKDGDAYIDLVSGDTYRKEGGKWDHKGNFKGPQGEPGAPGTRVIVNKGNPPKELKANKGDFYINQDTGDYFGFDGTEWKPVGSFRSLIGANAGGGLLFGAEAPKDEVGSDGQGYFNFTTGDLYVKADGKWGTPKINLKGSGVAAKGWNFGKGEPKKEIGQDGEAYMDLDTNDVYVKEAGDWGKPRTNLRGAPGNRTMVGNDTPKQAAVPGNKGDIFINMSKSEVFTHDGAEWQPSGVLKLESQPVLGGGIKFGSGVPKDEEGADGSGYVDLATGLLYVKEAGKWGDAKFNLKALAGMQIEIASGDPTDTTPGKAGDYYVNSDTGAYFKHDGTKYQPKGVFKGMGGAGWLYGETAPADTLGQDGQGYLDYKTGNFYLKAEGKWGEPKSNFKIKGDPGTQLLIEAGAPKAETKANKGDYYIDSDTGNYYQYDGEKWGEPKGQIKAAGGTAIPAKGWHFGNGAPGETLGENGEAYFDLVKHDVYVKAEGKWGEPKTNLNGAPGANGTSIVIPSPNSGPAEKVVEALAKEIPVKDLAGLELPYITPPGGHPVKTIMIGQATVGQGTSTWVQDAQVLFQFQLDLPHPDKVEKIVKAEMLLPMRRYTNDDQPDTERTELICLLDAKVCSGHRYQAKTWLSNWNNKFFPNDGHGVKGSGTATIPNALFADKFFSKEIPTTLGPKKHLFANENAVIDLTEMFGSAAKPLDLMKALYGDLKLVPGGVEKVRRSLRMVVADDILVSNGKIRIEFELKKPKAPEAPKLEAPKPEGTGQE